MAGTPASAPHSTATLATLDCQLEEEDPPSLRHPQDTLLQRSCPLALTSQHTEEHPRMPATQANARGHFAAYRQTLACPQTRSSD